MLRRYGKVSRPSGAGGFRLRRFSVQAFRERFVFMFRIVSKCKYTYCRVLRFLKRGGDQRRRRIGKVSEMGSSRSMNGLLVAADYMPRSHECRMRSSFGRSESFYSEAIADCLEFIKRTSVDSSDKDEDEKQQQQQVSPQN
ncbi:unnamed protein product [Rhodiola kirilowii]